MQDISFKLLQVQVTILLISTSFQIISTQEVTPASEANLVTNKDEVEGSTSINNENILSTNQATVTEVISTSVAETSSQAQNVQTTGKDVSTETTNQPTPSTPKQSIGELNVTTGSKTTLQTESTTKKYEVLSTKKPEVQTQDILQDIFGGATPNPNVILTSTEIPRTTKPPRRYVTIFPLLPPLGTFGMFNYNPFNFGNYGTYQGFNLMNPMNIFKRRKQNN